MPSLFKLRGGNLTNFPKSGEIFAIDLGAQGLHRAVRNDLSFEVCSYFLDSIYK